MNTIEEQLTSALHRRDAELTVHDELDAVLNDDHIVRFTPQRTNPVKRRRLLAVAAASMLVVGAGGLIWAQRPEPEPPATADAPRTAVPASFPRLQFPAPESPSDPVLVGVQDYRIDGGWFSFLNYDREVDLNFDGNPTRAAAFSVATFTGTHADADRATCGTPVEVVQGDRTITISDRTQGELRFVWSEAPGVLVVVDASSISQDAALAAITTLQPVAEDVWQQRLDAVAPEVVTGSTDRDAIWDSYTGDENRSDQLVPPASNLPTHNNC